MSVWLICVPAKLRNWKAKPQKHLRLRQVYGNSECAVMRASEYVLLCCNAFTFSLRLSSMTGDNPPPLSHSTPCVGNMPGGHILAGEMRKCVQNEKKQFLVGKLELHPTVFRRDNSYVLLSFSCARWLSLYISDGNHTHWWTKWNWFVVSSLK